MPPELVFEKFAFRVYRGQVLTAEGEAADASFRRDTAGLVGERISVRFPRTATQPESRITAARGTGNVKERRFEGKGGVRAEQSGQVATTAEAHYSAEDGLVRGEKPVEVRDGRMTVRGPRFTLDPRDQLLHIEGGTHVVAGPGVP